MEEIGDGHVEKWPHLGWNVSLGMNTLICINIQDCLVVCWYNGGGGMAV